MSRQLLIILLLVINSLNAISQEKKDSLYEKAVDAYNQGKFEEAIILIKESAENYKKPQDTETYLSRYNDIFTLQSALNKALDFLVFEKKLLPFCQNKTFQAAKIFMNLGNAYLYDDYNYAKSENYYKKALSIFLKLPAEQDVKANISAIYSNLGYRQKEVGDFSNALLHYSSAELLAKEANRLDLLGKIHFNKGQIYERLDEYKNAEKEYLLSQKLQVNDIIEQIKININLGTLNLKDKLNNHPKAILYFETAEKYKGEIEDQARREGNIEKHFATYYQEIGDYTKARAFFQKSIKVNTLNKAFHNLSIGMKAMGYLEMESGNYKLATAYLQNGLEVIAKKRQYKSTKIEILQKLIKVGLLSNELSKNLTYCIQADSLIDLMRQEHTEQGSKFFWREKTHTFYENAIETCYRLKDYNKAFYFMEKSRAILLLDGLKDLDAKKILSVDKQNQEQNLRYKVIGLQNKLETDKKNYTILYQNLIKVKEEYNSFIQSLEKSNSAYYQLKYSNQYIPLSSLQAALKLSNQSFVEYFVGGNTVYAFVATAKDARMIKINLQEYNSLSKQFLLLTAQKPPHTAAQLKDFCLGANKLYQLIYAPLNIPVGRVIISQDNYFLPFGALVADAQRQKFLVEDYAFSYSYSANILFREKEKSISFNKSLLGFSPIHYNKSLNLNTLSGSDQVLNSIEDKYFSGKVFLEKQATKQNFIQNAPNYKIIQLFTHGKADTVSDKSKIYFYDDALNMSELYQLEKLKAELIVLSACETNLGSNATGEGIMSFARGFAYLGVPSTVSTLWSVNNQSTYQLTESFYKYLDDGYEKDIALQMAQKEYLKNSGYRFPYYWSGVVLVGDASSVSVFFFSFLPYLLFVLVLLGIFYFFKKNLFGIRY